jgi:hypothetical protein
VISYLRRFIEGRFIEKRENATLGFTPVPKDVKIYWMKKRIKKEDKKRRTGILRWSV